MCGFLIPARAETPLSVEQVMQRRDAQLNMQFDWWRMLHSSKINTLIEQSISASPTVADAQQTLLNAQQSEIIRMGIFHNKLRVIEAPQHPGKLVLELDDAAPTPATFIGQAYYDFHTDQFAVGFLPELLHNVPSSSASVALEVRQLQLVATYQTLVSNLIGTLVYEASLRAQLALFRKYAAIDQNLWTIARKRQMAGVDSLASVAQRQEVMQRSTQALQVLKQHFEQVRELRRILLGIAADAELPESEDFKALRLDEVLPEEISVRLFAQRPDIQAALLERSATGTGYSSTLTAATKNIQNVISAMHNGALEFNIASALEVGRREEYKLAQQQYLARQVDYTEVLIAEQNSLLASLDLIQARAKHLACAIGLYHALGGGWWTMEERIELEISWELMQNRY